MLVISNRPRASLSSDFEITHAITPWIVLYSIQLLLLLLIINFLLLQPQLLSLPFLNSIFVLLNVVISSPRFKNVTLPPPPQSRLDKRVLPMSQSRLLTCSVSEHLTEVCSLHFECSWRALEVHTSFWFVSSVKQYWKQLWRCQEVSLLLSWTSRCSLHAVYSWSSSRFQVFEWFSSEWLYCR